MREGCRIAILLAVFLLIGAPAVDGGDFKGDYSKLSGIIIPGFASTQLRAWSILDCPYSPLDFNPLDLVWLDTTKLLSAVNCWLKCILLDPYNQTDHPECKSRPDSGLSAITELDPGYITGPLSSVWKEWVKWCIEFGIEANAIIAVPFDWRLPPSMLEERDLYFHKLKLTFETALKLRGGPSLVFAHSLGNNVFRYFLEWLKLEIAPKHYIQWLDEHIHAYFAVGAPLLGATETVKGILSGQTFGLPVSEGTARLMFNSFGSSLWMLPFTKYCRAENEYWKHLSGGIRKGHHTYQCEEQEFQSNYSGWPTNIVNIEIPSNRGFEAYPSISEIAENSLSNMECGLPRQLSFSAREVSDGTLFKAIEDYDSDSKRLLYQLHKWVPRHTLSPFQRIIIICFRFYVSFLIHHCGFFHLHTLSYASPLGLPHEIGTTAYQAIFNLTMGCTPGLLTASPGLQTCSNSLQQSTWAGFATTSLGSHTDQACGN
ncbi:hypothetical protein SLEP1_g14307 [Rubroshorea leprosula]|uniref:Phospholipid--sterol O-acyltransferase n=2 Tax=Rubroshorea leprosula TaxID=152421 RepID=A0AAV5IU69_9ROSI|nr:hypothetical protein SLEP1_g14307 [Rubroshorea leprosula]